MRLALAVVAAWNGFLTVSAVPVVVRGGFHGLWMLPFALWTLACGAASAWAALSRDRAARAAARLLVFSGLVVIPWVLGFAGVTGVGCAQVEWLSFGVLCVGSLALSLVIPVVIFAAGVVRAK